MALGSKAIFFLRLLIDKTVRPLKQLFLIRGNILPKLPITVNSGSLFLASP